MPVDYYPQKSVDELLAILDAVQKRASTGVVFFTTAAGVQNQRSFQGASPTAVEIRRILYSLFLRDSVTYANPYASRTRRTRARYTFS